jgi:hypothetical protein
MNKINFTAILQIALWKNEGISELEIRKLLADFANIGKPLPAKDKFSLAIGFKIPCKQ